MLIIHISVFFKFRPDVPQEHKQAFTTELKQLKHLPCVKDGRLFVGGPSITDPIERSKGFEIALVSYHADRDALAQYQASDEHHRYVILVYGFWPIATDHITFRVISTYMFPFKEDLMRFDFELDPEDEYMCNYPISMLG